MIDAFKWTGGCDQTEEPQWWVDFKGAQINVATRSVCIPNPMGHVHAQEGDYIIKGIGGEIYPCPAAVFELSYEPVKDITTVGKKESLKQAVQDLEQFAGQLRMMEDSSQIQDGVYIQDCVAELYDIVERSVL